jgi:sorbitol-specific phosphotransferase system component IIA
MMADLDLISMGERQNFELGEVSLWVTGDTEARRNGEVEASGN